MESLDQQLEALVQDAPNDGVTVSLLRAIAPLLKETASQLQHAEYHVLLGKDAGWAVTTLSNRTQPELEKSVIYAFSTYEDAHERAANNKATPLTVSSLPVTHLLFRLIALQTVESAIFFEEAGNSRSGIEILCNDLRHQVRSLLASYSAQLRPTGPVSPPSDIA